jgi:hypothetical protein
VRKAAVGTTSSSSYAEELDPEKLLGPSFKTVTQTTHTLSSGTNSTARNGRTVHHSNLDNQDMSDEDGENEDIHNHAGPPKRSITNGTDGHTVMLNDYVDREYDPQKYLKSLHSTSTQQSRSLGTTNSSSMTGTQDGGRADKDLLNHSTNTGRASAIAKPVTAPSSSLLGIDGELHDSWARSSRSSRGSRYSYNDDQERISDLLDNKSREDDDDDHQDQDVEPCDYDGNHRRQNDFGHAEDYALNSSTRKGTGTVTKTSTAGGDAFRATSHHSSLGKTGTALAASGRFGEPSPTAARQAGKIDVPMTSSPNDATTSISANISANAGAGRTEQVLADGTRLILYKNGTRKEVYPNGQSLVQFANGDTKRSDTDGVVVYYYAQARTTHTTYKDGLQVYEFPNNQVQHR